jgi:hypothetical protein
VLLPLLLLLIVSLKNHRKNIFESRAAKEAAEAGR